MFTNCASDGDDWVEQRRFIIAILRNFGMGKNLMEEKVRISVKNMTDFIEKQDLSSINIGRPIQVFVANIINEFLFGNQHSFDNCDKLMEFVDDFSELLNKFAKSPIVGIVLMLPWTRHLPLISTYWKKINDRSQKMFTYIRHEVSQVRSDPSEESTCYVQEFYKSNKDKRPEQLLACCSDMFTAGMARH
ncbi:hypothetical protein PMAYCL1PPCAC_21257 [Pristionchus mayeri]|uniref:Cytochrome P450 n=1 Tax=Pristionchus mayeri TaxID=1317129 RepID=A0AAN5CUW9_9BILA|nr:hypothetical protein PMAYCL1PPCAC_21257 [Pristionchus mayeri]